MAAKDHFIRQFEFLDFVMSEQVSDLNNDVLNTRPDKNLNPTGFIYWHLLRIWDRDLNIHIKGQEGDADAWHRGGFSEKMNYSPLGHGTMGLGIGHGYTNAEVDEPTYDLAVLREYHKMLLDEELEYLRAADDTELERVIFPNGEESTTGFRVFHSLGHCWNHLGELRLTKSMQGYKDSSTPDRD